MPRVVLICFDFHSKNLNKQPWNFAWKILEQFTEHGFDVSVITDSPETEVISGEIDKIETVPSLYDSKGSFSSETLDVLNNLKPDLVLYLMGVTDIRRIKLFKNFPYPVVPLLGSPLYKISDFYHLKYSDWKKHFTFLKYGLLSAITPDYLLRQFCTAESISGLVTLSPENFDKLSKVVKNKKRVVFIPPPIHPDFLKFDISSSTTDQTGLRVLYFGPPQFFRGLDTLLYAISELVRRYPDKPIELSLLSRLDAKHLQKNEQEVLALIRNLNLEAVTRIQSGLLSRRQIIDEILASKVVVLPFKYIVSEVPLVNLEAAALGRPVISTTLPGVKKYTELFGGITISPGNINALSNAIEEILFSKNDPDYQNRSEKLREYYNKYENSITKILELIPD